MNVFTATGNLGGDAEVRYTKSGTAVAQFSLPVKSGYGDKEKTTWVRCLIWGKRAEGGLIGYLKKGQMVCVSGEISLNEWETKEGVQKSSLELNVREITLCGGKPAASDQPSQDGDFPDEFPF